MNNIDTRCGMLYALILIEIKKKKKQEQDSNVRSTVCKYDVLTENRIYRIIISQSCYDLLKDLGMSRCRIRLFLRKKNGVLHLIDFLVQFN